MPYAAISTDNVMLSINIGVRSIYMSISIVYRGGGLNSTAIKPTRKWLKPGPFSSSSLGLGMYITSTR